MAQKGLQEEIFDKARSILSVLWSVLVAAEPTYHIDPAELEAKGVVQVVEARHCFITTHRRGKFPDRISALLQRDNSISDGSAPGAIIPHESIGFG
jgi:hypothetical protein